MIHRLLVLINTGMPGLQKLIIFIVAERILTRQMLGEFSSDYALVQLISLVSVVGWCGLILSRVPKLEIVAGKRYVYTILKYSFFYYAGAVVLIGVLSFFNIAYNAVDISIFLFSWTLYQLLRHFAIAQKRHLIITIADFIALSVVVLLMWFSIRAFVALSISFIIGGVILGFRQLEVNSSKVKRQDQKKAFEFAISNFMGSFGVMGLPVLVSATDNTGIAGVIGYTLSMIIALQLLTRSLAFIYIPEMASAAGSHKIDVVYKKFIKNNALCTLLSALFMVFVYAVITRYSLVSVLESEESFWVYMLLLISGSTASLTVPLQNYLMAIERSDLLSRNSCLYAGVIGIGYVVYYLFFEFFSVELLILYLVFSRLFTAAILYFQLNSIRRNDVAKQYC